MRVENHTLDVTIRAVVDTPDLASPSEPGREDTDLVIPLSASPRDSDGSETVSGVYICDRVSGL